MFTGSLYTSPCCSLYPKLKHTLSLWFYPVLALENISFLEGIASQGRNDATDTGSRIVVYTDTEDISGHNWIDQHYVCSSEKGLDVQDACLYLKKSPTVQV